MEGPVFFLVVYVDPLTVALKVHGRWKVPQLPSSKRSYGYITRSHALCRVHFTERSRTLLPGIPPIVARSMAMEAHVQTRPLHLLF